MTPINLQEQRDEEFAAKCILPILEGGFLTSHSGESWILDEEALIHYLHTRDAQTITATRKEVLDKIDAMQDKLKSHGLYSSELQELRVFLTSE
jgi:hypothetical protein